MTRDSTPGPAESQCRRARRQAADVACETQSLGTGRAVGKSAWGTEVRVVTLAGAGGPALGPSTGAQHWGPALGSSTGVQHWGPASPASSTLSMRTTIRGTEERLSPSEPGARPGSSSASALQPIGLANRTRQFGCSRGQPGAQRVAGFDPPPNPPGPLPRQRLRRSRAAAGPARPAKNVLRLPRR